MTDTPTAPTLCEACREKLQPDHAYAFCPHTGALAIADHTPENYRWVTFGPMSEDEALDVVQDGVAQAVERYRGETKH